MLMVAILTIAPTSNVHTNEKAGCQAADMDPLLPVGLFEFFWLPDIEKSSGYVTGTKLVEWMHQSSGFGDASCMERQ